MGVKISELTSMGTLAGTEKLAGVDSGTQYTTPADLKTYLDAYFVSLANATPVACTPSASGMALSSVSARSWKLGNILFMSGVATIGSVAGSEARINLCFNGGDGNATSRNTTPAPVYGTLEYCGGGVSDVQTQHFAILIEPNKTYVTIGKPGASAGLAKANGNALFTNGDKFSFDFRVMVQ